MGWLESSNLVLMEILKMFKIKKYFNGLKKMCLNFFTGELMSKIITNILLNLTWLVLKIVVILPLLVYLGVIKH